MAHPSRIAQLMVKKLSGTLSSEEQEELQTWVEESPDHQATMEACMDPDALAKGQAIFWDMEIASTNHKMEQTIKSAYRSIKENTRKRKRKRLRNTLSIGLGLILLFSIWPLFHGYSFSDNRTTEITSWLKTTPTVSNTELAVNNALPILLDTVKDSRTIPIGNLDFRKAGKSHLTVSWRDHANDDTETSIVSTLSVPWGKDTFRLSLPDSSQIDLSPGTSLYFYLRTRGTDILQRVISMNGQAFFKVSHVSPSNNSPLYIETTRGEIKVLGTLFSLRDYRQEDSLSLIPSQGRLSLCNGHKTDALEYPEIATLRTGEAIRLATQSATPEKWIDKPDLFDFHGKSLSEAMSEIAAWYKIKVVFEDSVTARPYGDVLIGRPDKSLTIDQMLKILNGGDLLFQRSGQTVYVSRHDH